MWCSGFSIRTTDILSVGGCKTSAVRYKHKKDSKRPNKTHYLGGNVASDGSSPHSLVLAVQFPHRNRAILRFIRIKTPQYHSKIGVKTSEGFYFIRVDK